MHEGPPNVFNPSVKASILATILSSLLMTAESTYRLSIVISEEEKREEEVSTVYVGGLPGTGKTATVVRPILFFSLLLHHQLPVLHYTPQRVFTL